jgi:hypothetical protein
MAQVSYEVRPTACSYANGVTGLRPQPLPVELYVHGLCAGLSRINDRLLRLLSLCLNCFNATPHIVGNVPTRVIV